MVNNRRNAMKAVVFLTVAALALGASVAQTAPRAAHVEGSDASSRTPAKSCFRTSEIRAHKFGDDESLYLRVGTHDVYKAKTTGSCKAGHFRDDPLILDPAPPNGLVCDALDLTLKVGHQGQHGFATPCIVSGITKLTPEQVAALPPKVRP
jgi:hypothetical protein